ncbi:MAG: D-alanyl-D-alanine carboxypeptidase family protein [Candidatus Nanopelagicales bacterium]
MARVQRLTAVAALLCAVVTVASPALAEEPTEPISTAQVVGGEQLALKGRQVNLGPGAKPLPDIWASSWVLADATTGEILASKGAHKLRAPASTLKMLTALTVLPRLDLSSTYVGRPSDVVSGTAMAGIKPGITYTVKQLLNGMMLPSGNDAARALAHANGGIPETVAQMNEVAAALGAADTVAKTPNGLDEKGQVSSAFDLALIARAGLARPDFATIVARKKAPFPSEGGGTHPIYTNNRLLLGGYKGCIGVKTGFTTEAGRTFVGAATRKGRTLVVALMGIKSGSAQAAAAALTWGFKNHDKVTPVGTLNVAGASLSPSAEPSASARQAVALVPSGPPATAAIAVPDVARTSWPPIVWYTLIGLVVIGVLVGAWLRRKSRKSPYSVI